MEVLEGSGGDPGVRDPREGKNHLGFLPQGLARLRVNNLSKSLVLANHLQAPALAPAAP